MNGGLWPVARLNMGGNRSLPDVVVFVARDLACEHSNWYRYVVEQPPIIDVLSEIAVLHEQLSARASEHLP